MSHSFLFIIVPACLPAFQAFSWIHFVSSSELIFVFKFNFTQNCSEPGSKRTTSSNYRTKRRKDQVKTFTTIIEFNLTSINTYHIFFFCFSPFLFRIVAPNNWLKTRFVEMHHRFVWMKLDRVLSALVRAALSILPIRMKLCREQIEIRFCFQLVLLNRWHKHRTLCQINPINLRVNIHLFGYEMMKEKIMRKKIQLNGRYSWRRT